MLRRLRLPVLLLGLATLGVPLASADPGTTNPNTVTRTLNCDNGKQLVTTFIGNGSNYNVSIDESVFIYKSITVTSPTGALFSDVRGIQGFDETSLVTCGYTSPSGNTITVTGFFTPQGG